MVASVSSFSLKVKRKSSSNLGGKKAFYLISLRILPLLAFTPLDNERLKDQRLRVLWLFPDIPFQC